EDAIIRLTYATSIALSISLSEPVVERAFGACLGSFPPTGRSPHRSVLPAFPVLHSSALRQIAKRLRSHTLNSKPPTTGKCKVVLPFLRLARSPRKRMAFE